MNTLPSSDFCIRRAAHILLNDNSNAIEALAWGVLAIAAQSPQELATPVAEAAIAFFAETGPDTFAALQQAVKGYIG